MTSKVTLSWKVVKALKEVRLTYYDSVLFNVSPNPGIYGQLGIPLRLGYIPQSLLPTVTYYQVVKKLLNEKWHLEIVDKKYPLRIFVPNLDTEVLFNLRIRIFPPHILSLTVSLSEFSTEFDPTNLINWQHLNNLEPIADIVRWTIGMTDTLDHKNFNPQRSFHFYPALHLEVCSADRFQKHIEDNLNKYVGILIRNHDYELMDRRIPDNIHEKNLEHNYKSSQELTLVDKQGILYLTPINDTNSKLWSRNFRKVQDIYEIAAVYATYLRNYPMLRSRNEDLADFMLHKIQFLIERPDMTFLRSVTHGHIWHLLSQEFRLKSTLETILRPSIRTDLEKKSSYFDQFTVGWWEEKEFPYLLNKRIAEAMEIDLGFLSSEDLRRLIINDYGEAKRSLMGRNYKATVVLCGSVIEAILTDIIDQAQIPGLSIEVLYTFGLSKLIDKAKIHGLIQDPNLYSLFDPLRNYRNAIHPGVQIRKSTSLDSSTARIAVETVNLLMKDLNNRVSSVSA